MNYLLWILGDWHEQEQLIKATYELIYHVETGKNHKQQKHLH